MKRLPGPTGARRTRGDRSGTHRGPAGGSFRPLSVTRLLCRGAERRVDRGGRRSSSRCRKGPVCPGPTLLLLLLLLFILPLILLSTRSLSSAPASRRRAVPEDSAS
ncbi:hypothetical protein EYF80_045097 [Liparis tanakae]|uniref:Uncharacterized protein n=1 Tax=Liparis tanakae TaxID=230148 RepID=A0A4Z2FV34_9TELE|nr:hypothetical protein EYF80_045097 [Liparis tanakae]